MEGLHTLKSVLHQQAQQLMLLIDLPHVADFDFKFKSGNFVCDKEMSGAGKTLPSSGLNINIKGSIDRYFEDDFTVLPNPLPIDILKEPPKIHTKQSKYFTIGQSDIDEPHSSSVDNTHLSCVHSKVEGPSGSDVLEHTSNMNDGKRKWLPLEKRHNLVSITEDTVSSSFIDVKKENTPLKIDLISKVGQFQSGHKLDNPAWYQSQTNSIVSDAFIKEFDNVLRKQSKSLPVTPIVSPKTARKNVKDHLELSKKLSHSLHKLPMSAEMSVESANTSTVSPLQQTQNIPDKVDGLERSSIFSFGSFGKSSKKLSVRNRDLNVFAPTSS